MAMSSPIPHPKSLAEVRAAVDVVIFTVQDNELRVLVVTRQHEPFAGQPALPGGFIWDGETSIRAAERLLHQKAGIKSVFMEQLYTFDAPHRDPRGRVVSIAYYALVPADQLKIEESEHTHKPALVATAKLPSLAFDHHEIVAYAVERLQAKIAYTNAAYSLLPPTFTLAQLQGVYETILGRTLDKRNFRKKYLSLGLIEATHEQVTGLRHRPAELYRYKQHRPVELPSPAL